MKRLGKKVLNLEETIEAYACNCASCSCGSGCSCSCWLFFDYSKASTAAYDPVSSGDYDDEITSSNYSK